MLNKENAMGKKGKPNKAITALAVLAVLVFGVTYLAITLTQNAGRNAGEVSEERALDALDRLYRKINVSTLPPIKENVDLEVVDIRDSLPDISKYPLQVDSGTAEYVEIFSSTEKATVTGKPGADNDRWLVDMAEAFNRSGAKAGGSPASVRIRAIASGVGMDYIASGKYVPDAFSPSNELWGDALAAQGADISLVEKRLCGNVAGIVLNKAKHADIVAKYGSVSLKSVTEAVAAGEITMGYTNPFASSTGANFLISTLYTFDGADPLGAEAASAFEGFQANIPFVAYTTLQMKDAAKSGALEGFVFEYQQFQNSPDLNADYVFTPYGVRHDSPVYEIGQLSAAKKDILRQFIDFCLGDESQAAASRYGFNGYDQYAFELSGASGGILASAQKLWKEKKAGDREIIAVFVADISGSMNGEPMNRLKESLLSGSKVIGQNCSVGLVTFSDSVNIALPIAKFDINQRSMFTGAVRSMSASGGTAMFDAIVVAQKMLAEAKEANPDAKLLIFVLTDGETNEGSTLNDTRSMIEGLRVPIYTIGYNEGASVLGTLASINEAASINADTDDVVYQLQNLFNAEM